MNDWHALGTLHKLRHDVDARAARHRTEDAVHRSAVSLERWPAIASAISGIAASYNHGIGRQRLLVTEGRDDGRPSVTIASASPISAMIVVTVDDGELCVTQYINEAQQGLQRWVDLHRSDDGTAAYILQDWLERL